MSKIVSAGLRFLPFLIPCLVPAAVWAWIGATCTFPIVMLASLVAVGVLVAGVAQFSRSGMIALLGYLLTPAGVLMLASVNIAYFITTNQTWTIDFQIFR